MGGIWQLLALAWVSPTLGSTHVPPPPWEPRGPPPGPPTHLHTAAGSCPAGRRSGTGCPRSPPSAFCCQGLCQARCRGARRLRRARRCHPSPQGCGRERVPPGQSGARGPLPCLPCLLRMLDARGPACTPSTKFLVITFISVVKGWVSCPRAAPAARQPRVGRGTDGCPCQD